jgi:hypothetical protein
MSKVWYERRDKSGEVIQRVGPFHAGSDEANAAFHHQMAIADAHNHGRQSGDLSRQLVWPIIEDQADSSKTAEQCVNALMLSVLDRGPDDNFSVSAHFVQS